METIIGLIIGVAIAAVISGAIVWIVGKLGLGLEVDNFGWAMLAGVLIGLLTNLILQFMTDFGGLGGVLVRMVVAAGAIYASGAALPGLRVKGYLGALIAAVAIALTSFGLAWLLSLVLTA